MKSDKFDFIGGIISPVSEKYGKPGLLPGSQRVEMCRLGCTHSSWIDVDDWESKQDKWVRTAVTLDSLKQRLSTLVPNIDITIAFVMSADCLESMTKPGVWDISLVYSCLFFYILLA